MLQRSVQSVHGTAPLEFAQPSAGAAQPVVEAFEECYALHSQQLTLAAELTPVAYVADLVLFCIASADGPAVEGGVVRSMKFQLQQLSDRSAALRCRMDALDGRLFAVQADGSASQRDMMALEEQLAHVRHQAAQTQERLQALLKGRAAPWLWLPGDHDGPWYTPRARLPELQSPSMGAALLAHAAARGIGARALFEVAAWPAHAPLVATLLGSAAAQAAGQAYGVTATHAAAAAGNVPLLRELAVRGSLTLGARVRRRPVARYTVYSPVMPEGYLSRRMVASALAGARYQVGCPLSW